MLPNFLQWLTNLVRGNYRQTQAAATPTPTMTPSPTPTPAPDYSSIINQGFSDWGGGTPPPIATASSQLAELGGMLPHRYLPAALSLKETGGLSTAGADINNAFGIGPHIKYPDIKTNIMGGGNMGANGGPQRGLKGVLLGNEKEPSKYKKYLETGNLRDFFEVYTPQSDVRNPKIDEQVQMMERLLKYFENAEKKSKEAKN